MMCDEIPETPTTGETEPAAVVQAPAPAAGQPGPGPAPKRERAAHPKPSAAPQVLAAPQGPASLGTGRRKESVARVRLTQGLGTVVINRRPYEQYFAREALRLTVRQPLLLTHQLGKLDVHANVEGGGLTGQAGAIRLGIARALLQVDPSLRATLRGAGLLTRDPRMKERKKYGQKGARKRFQWTKR